MAIRQLPPIVTDWVGQLARHLDARLAPRLAVLLGGLLWARGRRTVTSWFRAARIRDEFSDDYYFLFSLGHHIASLGASLLTIAIRVIVPGDRLLLAIDDTPTKRYGPKVQGAGVHHNPTPGPAAQKFLYGHVWVVLAWLVRHPRWGTISLPLRALMYVRLKDRVKLPPKTRAQVPFRTKLEMAVELIAWAAPLLNWLGKSLWIVADGAYAKRPLLRAARAMSVVVVSRLRKDARLFDLPKPRRHRGRGRPRKYGDRISLAKRGAHARGWQTETMTLYGREVTKTYKTFVAAYPPAGGDIRVVIVRETDGWIAFFCTDPKVTVTEILEAVADRAAIEQTFHDAKEIYGAGQQQLRNYWTNLAAFNLNLWALTLVELWAWTLAHVQLCDRTANPWDDPDRRPSHADRRNALRRHCLGREFSAIVAAGSLPRKCRALLTALLEMVG